VSWEDERVNMSVRACERCGAIVALASEGGGSLDNEPEHIGWHEGLDDVLAGLTSAAMAAARRLPDLREDDLRIEVFTNGTPEATARIVHLPTGVTAEAKAAGSIAAREQALAKLIVKVQAA
jgi:hypothetical protein